MRILGAVLCAAALLPSARAVTAGAGGAFAPVRTFDGKPLSFEIHEPTGHPFYWWPRTLLSYPVRFTGAKVAASRLQLKSIETGEQAPFQLSSVREREGALEFAILNFFADLPSGGTRRFELSLGAAPLHAVPGMREFVDGASIVLDGGAMQIRIPRSRAVAGEAPGPIMQTGRAGKWIGTSRLTAGKRRVLRIDTAKEESGPLFIAYRVAYTLEGGASYVAHVRAVAGYDFALLREEIAGIGKDEGAYWEVSWSGFHPTHRAAPNHPYAPDESSRGRRSWDRFEWERIDEQFVDTQHGVVAGTQPDGEISFRLGAYQPWAAYVMLTSASFWDLRTKESIGVFIDRPVDWQDHDYAIWTSSNTLQVRYFYRNGTLSWKWPLSTGTRSTGIAAYDHTKNLEQQERQEKMLRVQGGDGLTYGARVFPMPYTLFLENRYGTVSLNDVKDWVLAYPAEGRKPEPVFREGREKTPAEFTRMVLTSGAAAGMMSCGPRQNSGFGPGWREAYQVYTDALNRLGPAMTPRQWQRVTGWFLMLSYVAAGENLIPMQNMLGGHPNFLSEVKSLPALSAFLFPDHPMAHEWAAEFEKFLDLNTRYHTRPEVEAWDARGGRWTENLGTYVWAFLRPAVRAEFALRKYFDGKNRLATPRIAAICDWALNALSAPFNGEDPKQYLNSDGRLPLHYWGIATPENGPRRLHPPQGAHSVRRIPPRLMWYLGDSMRNYRPLLAEYLMWAARPDDDDMEHLKTEADPWRIMYGPDNRGTDPHLRSAKYTGYGTVLRAAVGAPDELSIHLQQIDEGPNYRWGMVGEGGNGVIYYYAQGKSFSHNGREDVGDRPTHDTDFSTNFGVWKDGKFKSIGRNVLNGPLYDLGTFQFAEIRARQSKPVYSSPEYRGRSVLLAGSDYFVTYDDVYADSVAHRFSWFTHTKDELPFIHFVKGGDKARERLGTKVESREVRGVWHDGYGDAMAVITHKPEVTVSARSFGCTVGHPGGSDTLFRNPDGIAYSEGGLEFQGTAGIVRHTTGGDWELAIFDGKRIAAGGLALTVEGKEFGASARFREADEVEGMSYGPDGGTLRLECPACSGRTFYVDGVAQPRAAAEILRVPAGRHTWQLTAGLPRPAAPAVLRTENGNGMARVVWNAVPGAESYTVEISRDLAQSWSPAGRTGATSFELRGLENGSKYHVRLAASNRDRASGPGPEYPLYASADAPHAPDGLHLEIEPDRVGITWGEVLGVREYRLYRRVRGSGAFERVYSGTAMSFADRAAGVIKAFEKPGIMQNALRDKSGYTVYEYAVSAVNGNGESAKSPAADTDPASWVNWDPKPGEPFRRRYQYNTIDYFRIGDEAPHDRYYPR